MTIPRTWRDLTATAPNQLLAADLTYVTVVYVASVLHVFSRMILGLRAATSMKTDPVLDTLDMAMFTPGQARHQRLSGLVHHNDAGSQGGFRRSTQQLDVGGGVAARKQRKGCAGGGGVGRSASAMDGGPSVATADAFARAARVFAGGRAHRWPAAAPMLSTQQSLPSSAGCPNNGAGR